MIVQFPNLLDLAPDYFMTYLHFYRRRPVQLKENSLTSSGPMKSRLADRMNG